MKMMCHYTFGKERLNIFNFLNCQVRSLVFSLRPITERTKDKRQLIKGTMTLDLFGEGTISCSRSTPHSIIKAWSLARHNTRTRYNSFTLFHFK